MLAAGSRRLEITSSKMGGVTLAPAEVISFAKRFFEPQLLTRASRS